MRLHKQKELIRQEKRDEIVVFENSSLSKQQGKDKSITDEVNEEGPKEGLNLLVQKDESANITVEKLGQWRSAFQLEINDTQAVSNGLSMLAHEVRSDDITVDVKGPRSNIFQ